MCENMLLGYVKDRRSINFTEVKREGGVAMKKVKLYFINACMLACVNIIMRTVSVSFNAYVSNRIGAEGMGVLTLAMSVYGLSVTLACSGINLAAMRLTVETVTAYDAGYTPRFSVRGVMLACICYSLAFGLVTGSVLFASSEFIAVKILGDIRTLPSLRALAVSLPPISLSSALSGYFTGVRKVYKNISVSLIEQFIKITVTSMGLVLIAPAGIEYACLAVVGGSALAEGASLLTSVCFYLADKIRKNEKKKSGAPSEQIKSGLRAVCGISLPVAVAAYMRQGLSTIENIMIPRGLKRSGADHTSALASYGTLCGMVLPLIMFPSAVMSAFSGLLVPEISECRELKDYRKIRSVASRVFRASLVFSVAVSGIFITFSYDIGMSIYGSAEAARQIRMIAPLIPIMYLDSSVDGMLKGLGEQVHSMRINIIDAAVSLVLVLILVPQMGIDGYIAVIYICETLNAVLSIARLIKVTDLRADILKWVGLPLMCIIFSTGVIKFLSGYPIPLLGMTAEMPVRLVAVVISYIALIFASGAINKDDIGWARGVIKKDPVN